MMDSMGMLRIKVKLWLPVGMAYLARSLRSSGRIAGAAG